MRDIRRVRGILTIVLVASPGPPRVSTNARSNTWNELIMEMISTKKVVGASSGTVM